MHTYTNQEILRYVVYFNRPQQKRKIVPFLNWPEMVSSGFRVGNGSKSQLAVLVGPRPRVIPLPAMANMPRIPRTGRVVLSSQCSTRRSAGCVEFRGTIDDDHELHVT